MSKILLKAADHFQHPRLNSGSSSRKEKDPIVVQIDRPILVLTVALPKRRIDSTSDAGFFITFSVQVAKIPHPNTLVTLKRVQLSWLPGDESQQFKP
jgi:hypothetical protein